MFRLEHVSKRYGPFTALDDLSVTFCSGTVSAIIGSSGSGKSTLLRLLLGLTWPDAGQVLIDERALARTDRLAVRRRIGYVIQEGGLFPHLTVRGNLALLPRHLRWPRARVEARARELCELMQLPGSLLERYPAELSGGQRQRVAVMRALMTDPPALLLDEPLGALDPLVRFELQESLQQLFRGLGKTVLLVTHDLPEAAYLATRLVLMRAGRIIQDGDAADLYERPADEFVRRFVAAQRGPPPRVLPPPQGQ
ncbi:MAG TPA: ATP-binding cassette domain-containing protein [Steroidobacteraceae bacterium]|nr:ATP-binding cassette domain-containing protein [Steroidobacteraceae bacterium]